jgi:hypothetical protein
MVVERVKILSDYGNGSNGGYVGTWVRKDPEGSTPS